MKLQTFKNSVYQIFKYSIFFILYWPILLIMGVPIHTYRLLVWILSKLFKPSLGRMLSFHSVILALDHFDKKPSATLMPCLLFDGQLDIELVKKRFKNVIASDEYAELRSTLKKWMGFYFWKIDSHFSFDNHITIIDTPTRRDALPKIEKDLSSKPYPRNKPLWELIFYTHVIPDTGDTRHGVTSRTTIVMFRIHHCLADGYSILKFIDQVSEQPIFTSVPRPTYPKQSLAVRLNFWLRLIFSGPGEFVKTVRDQHYNSRWNPHPWESLFDFNEDWTDEVDFKDLREISQAFDVPPSVIIFSAYSGVVRRIMLEQGEEIPKKFVMTIPFPMPGHPSNPTNHMQMVHFLAPLKIQDPIERLQEVKKRLNYLKKSPVFLHLHWWSAIYGYMAGFGLFGAYPLSPVILNNFPGPTEVQPFVGLTMLTFNLSGGIPLANCKAMLCSHSYGGRLILRVLVDTILYKEPEIPKKMLRWAVQEIHFLKNAAKKESV